MKSTLKLAYFGTPSFSAELIKKILTEGKETFNVICVVTQPDKPVGRKQVMTPSPVKQLAQAYGIPTYDNINKEVKEVLDTCDIALVFAYGHIIKPDLLRAPKYGFWNVHPSALPLYRGASPLVFPMLLGDKASAISLIRMDERMDHGPIIAQKSIELPPEIMYSDMLNQMAQMSYYILLESVQNISTSSLVLTAQKEDKASYTQLLSRQSGYISLPLLRKLLKEENLTYEELPEIFLTYLRKNPHVSYNPPNGMQLLWNMYRSLSPWPGVWTEIELEGVKKRLKIVGMAYNEGSPKLTSVQLEGKNPVSYASFLESYRIA